MSAEEETVTQTPERRITDTLRRLCQERIGLTFPLLGFKPGHGQIKKPPVNLLLSRQYKGLYVQYSTPVEPELIETDRGLCVALEAALTGFLTYEVVMRAEIDKQEKAKDNGHARTIILPGEF